jgi:hypothetical protein
MLALARHADLWLSVGPTDDRLRGLYMRHYRSAKATRRRGPCAPQQMRVVGPGEVWAGLTADCRAGWIWRWSRYRKDGQRGVECTLFRNEGTDIGHHRSACLVRGAMWFAWTKWPGKRLFTFVDPRKVRSTNPGSVFLRAGWQRAGITKRGLLIFEVAL